MTEEKVPIRWMAPESTEHSIYNEATDVVSRYIYTHYQHLFFDFNTVVVWSDIVGDIHMWEGALCWNTCHASSD